LVAVGYRDESRVELDYTVHFQCLGCGGACAHTKTISRPDGFEGRWDLSNEVHQKHITHWLKERDLILDHMSVADPDMIGEPADWSTCGTAYKADMDLMVPRYGAFGLHEVLKRYHHRNNGCDIHWERYGLRLCSVLGVVPGRGMHHYGRRTGSRTVSQ
jgi:hypothetical protein